MFIGTYCTYLYISNILDTTYPTYPDTPTTTTTQDPVDQIFQPEYPMFPSETPTFPPPQYHPTNGRSYENYDQKYNIYENPEEQEPGENPREKIHHNKARVYVVFKNSSKVWTKNIKNQIYLIKH